MECDSGRKRPRALLIRKDKTRPDERMTCSLGPEKKNLKIGSWSVSGGRKRLQFLLRQKKNKNVQIIGCMERESGRKRPRPLNNLLYEIITKFPMTTVDGAWVPEKRTI